MMEWTKFTVKIGGQDITGHFNPVDGFGSIHVKDTSFSDPSAWILELLPEHVAIKRIWIENSTFTSFSGLGRFPFLENLWITSSKIGSMACVEACTLLKYVRVVACHLDTMAWMAPLINIEVLDLGKNDIIRIEGVAGKQHLRVLALNENKITSTAGLKDLPAIKCLSIAKNAIVEVPNPAEMLALIGSCRVPGKANPYAGGFSDKENPIHEIVQGGTDQPYQPIYMTLYFKQQFERAIPEFKRRLDAGEVLTMGDVKEALRLEDGYRAFGYDDFFPKIGYESIFKAARNAGFEVNAEMIKVDDNVLFIRKAENSDFDAIFFDVLRRFF